MMDCSVCDTETTGYLCGRGNNSIPVKCKDWRHATCVKISTC